MNITRVSNPLSVLSAPPSKKDIIDALEKQRVQLQDLMKEINDSNLDSDTKKEKIKDLRDQIEQIDLQIQKTQADKLNKKPDKKDGENELRNPAPDMGEDSAAVNLVGMPNLLQAASSYSNSKVLYSVKNGVEGRKRTIEAEIRTDGFTTPYKQNNLQSADSRQKALDESAGVQLRETQTQLRKSADDRNEHSRTADETGGKEEND